MRQDVGRLLVYVGAAGVRVREARGWRRAGVRSGGATAPERGRGESGSLGQGSEEHVTSWAVTDIVRIPGVKSKRSHTLQNIVSW
jgi:hypothetical protein